MKTKPILFSGPMVRAILDGRKTQTRRLGNIQDANFTELGVSYIGHSTKGTVAQATYRAFPNGGGARWAICECPYGVPGDFLWVRETWQRCTGCYGSPGFVYRADCDHVPAHKWKPSIFMPKNAARIWLRVTDVRCERVQDISEEGARAEGCEQWTQTAQDIADMQISDASPIEKALATALGPGTMPAKMEFRILWEEIHGPAAWERNEWVWVIHFDRCTTPQGGEA